MDACFCPGADPKLLNFDWNLAVMPPAEYETMFAEVERAYRLAGESINAITEFHAAGHHVDNAAAFRWLRQRLAPSSEK